MGTISIENANNLFWLGRYAERTFTTLKEFHSYYDKMIDVDENVYKTLCTNLTIPDNYKSKEEFIKSYLFDKDNVNSIYSSLSKAFDNAVVVREEISTTALSYIQLALDRLERAEFSNTLLFDLLAVTDYLYAFWGSIDDNVESEISRNIIKCGRYIERTDLYIRLSYAKKDIEKELAKLKNRASKLKIKVDGNALEKVEKIIEEKEIDENKYELLELLPQLYTA